MKRDNKWLLERFKYLFSRYFSDIEIKNNLVIKFGRPCLTRLGSIKKATRSASWRMAEQKNFDSIVTINGHFTNSEIPVFVIDAVLSHEFMHYAHGFASPHKQAFKHPHKGGLVDWDLKERGLEDILDLQKKWLKKNWKEFLRKNHPYQRRKRRLVKSLFSNWLLR